MRKLGKRETAACCERVQVSPSRGRERYKSVK